MLRLVPFLLVLLAASPALAGGGPESTVVVANADSPDSLEIANAYVRERSIPPENLLVLTGVPKEQVIPVDTFRTAILAPIEAYLAAHDPHQRIDLIAYSAGFPYGVDYSADAKAKGVTIAPPLSATAALTALTYLGRRVEKSDVDYLGMQVNGYFRGFGDQGDALTTRGFHSRYAWNGEDEPHRQRVQDEIDRYWLSVSLAYTGPNGTTVAEALEVLKTAAASDGTNPKGTFYFLENDDVRAKTREPQFPSAVAALKAMGKKAEILKKGDGNQTGVLPCDREDVLGVVAGIAGFDWSKCGSRLLPGAIAEHLTSFGAHFGTAGQTKCVKFLLAGAAGTGGTVAEPYAIPHKFPSAWVQVHYARGASMAEAMYQSLWGPYQYMVIGDPLARPFASFAKVEVAAPTGSAALQGSVEVRAKATPAEGHPLATMELWVDGAWVSDGTPDEPIPWDTTKVEDGPHEIRLVVVEDSPIETRSWAAANVVVKNGSGSASLKGPTKPVLWGHPVKLTGSSSSARSFEIREGFRVVATVDKGGSFSVEVPSETLGVGTVSLRAVATAADGKSVWSAPFEVTVEAPPAPKPEPKPDPKKNKPPKKSH